MVSKEKDAEYFNMIKYLNDGFVWCYISKNYDNHMPIVRIRGGNYVVKVDVDNIVISRKLFFKLMRLV